MNEMNTKLQRAASLLLLTTLSLVTACEPADLVQPDDTRAAKVSLKIESGALLSSFGDSAIIKPSVFNAAGEALTQKAIRWETSPAGILVQDGDGAFRAIANGRVKIKAMVDVGETGVRPSGYWAQPIVDSVTIDVQQRASRLVLLPVDTAFTTLGASRKVTVQVVDARGNALTGILPVVEWIAAQPKVVAVDDNGLVKSIAEGVGLLNVRAAGLIGAVTFTVRPRLPHTSCMVFSQKRQAKKQSCVTVDFTMRERGATE